MQCIQCKEQSVIKILSDTEKFLLAKIICTSTDCYLHLWYGAVGSCWSSLGWASECLYIRPVVLVLRKGKDVHLMESIVNRLVTFVNLLARIYLIDLLIKVEVIYLSLKQ